MNISDIEQVKGLFFQVAMLLGVAIVVYLYINLRSNKKRKEKAGRRKFNLGNRVERVEGLSADEKFFYRQIFEAIPVPICRLNESGRIEMFNRLFERLMDKDPNTLFNQSFIDLFEGEAKLGISKLINTKLESRQSHAFTIHMNDKEYSLSGKQIDEPGKAEFFWVISFESKSLDFSK